MARKSRKRSRTRTRTVTRTVRRATGGIGKVFKGGTMSKVVAGIGGGVVGGLLLNQFMPQYSGIGKLGAAFLAGGPIGAVASVAVDSMTGQGSVLGNLFGGGRQEAGGL